MASFEKFYPVLSELEGGFQNLTSDPGNKNSLGVFVGTKYGISARFYEQVTSEIPTMQTMKKITKEEAKQLYLDYFWNENSASQIKSQAVANTVIDMQVNSGNGIRIAQEVLNDEFSKDLAVDGISGPNTIAAINSVDPAKFVEQYNFARVEYYMNVGNGEWISIWIRRVKKFALTSSPSFKYITLLLIIGAGVLIYKNLG